MALYCGQCKKPKPNCVCGRPRRCSRCAIARPRPICPPPVVSPEPCEQDDCRICKSNVRICSFTVKATDEVRKYHNSLVYSEENNTSYWVDDDGVPVITYRLPIYQDDFDPTTANVEMNTVYDFKNNRGYVFNPAGEYREFDLKEVA